MSHLSRFMEYVHQHNVKEVKMPREDFVALRKELSPLMPRDTEVMIISNVTVKPDRPKEHKRY